MEDVFVCAWMTIDHMGISISDRKHWDSKEALQKSSSNAHCGISPQQSADIIAAY